MKLRDWFFLGAFVGSSAFAISSAIDYGQRRSAPVDAPRVASDCRAACTLEGMELAGVEIKPAPHPAFADAIRCLCAPISGAGGDL